MIAVFLELQFVSSRPTEVAIWSRSKKDRGDFHENEHSVGNWGGSFDYGSMVGEPVNGSFHLDVQITDEAAVVRISGEKGSAVRRVLTDPKTCLINPLVTLLALDYADVELAE